MYDLTVNDAHAFFAEGVLVHNCCEAAEYSALHFNAQFSQTFTAFQSKAREIKPRPYAYI